MELNSASSTSFATEVLAAKLANNQQEMVAQQAMQLLESAAGAAPAPASLNLGANIDTYA
ncbi:hypothetical protein P2G88_06565 [Aliiglaciecola sp. CAU 1673]|uniref:hypothetical protein n=1 Tax=Aliiglaciecola sp. CAU 1673 TaxID=3032595 RepID=UPI0023DA7930|nr:hypothetical protein [Aliiglaciecola sp. CAU 1673]MDF2177910.1 hypothetical protein [Aliiglaciecola sp. CAU 1673]